MKKEIWKRKVEVHKMEWLYPCVRLEDFMKVCKLLEKENKKLKEYNWELIENHKKDIAILCEENKKLREEIENLKAIIEHYKKFEEWKNKLEWMLMEEGTLQ